MGIELSFVLASTATLHYFHFSYAFAFCMIWIKLTLNMLDPCQNLIALITRYSSVLSSLIMANQVENSNPFHPIAPTDARKDAVEDFLEDLLLIVN